MLCGRPVAIFRTLTLSILKPAIYSSCVSFSNSVFSRFKYFVGRFLKLFLVTFSSIVRFLMDPLWEVNNQAM